MNQQAYDNGVAALRLGDYPAAEREFGACLKSIDEHHEQYNRVASYVGLCQVLTGHRAGLLLCRDAASAEVLDGRVFLNLAIAEWRSGNRKRAIDCLHRGRKIDSGHAGLKTACLLIDRRKKPVLGFLPREHWLNRMLGRMLRRQTENDLTVQRLLFDRPA